METLRTWFIFAVGLTAMALGVLLWTVITVVLLPSRIARIKACNWFGKTVCAAMVKLSGCPVTVTGTEHLNGRRPAIYVSNHTSIMDIFLASSLSPVGTVGVAKKEVVWYPFFGQLYLLSGHLRIDRGRSAQAKETLARMGDMVREKGLSIFLWPEGTRSRDGRLLPLKKGLVYLAVQTGLPVVPIVVAGAHRSWSKGSLKLERVPIQVTVRPPIDTSGWSPDTAEEHLEEVAAVFRDVLPADQQPSESARAA